jgi:hypothetical protein
MKSVVATLAVTLMLANGAFAAAPTPLSMDLSSSALIDGASSEKIWQENVSAKIAKLYPTRRFRFVSEVAGGFNAGKTCVVSARAMLLPVVMLPVQGTKVIYAPIKSASAFDAASNLSQEQCQDLAKAKLKEAIQAMTAALAAT